MLGATAYKFYGPCDPHSGYPGWNPKFDVGAGVADHEDAVLSPFLYAVYLNGLHKALANGLGVRVVGRLVPLLLHVDDVVLMARSAHELQMLKLVSDSARKWRST